MSDDLLTYGTISRGFKTGGFFGGFPTNVAQLAPFDAETLWGLELGVKSDLADGRVRVNASVFAYDREDVQQNAGDPTSPIQHQTHHEHRRRRHRRRRSRRDLARDRRACR